MLAVYSSGSAWFSPQNAKEGVLRKGMGEGVGREFEEWGEHGRQSVEGPGLELTTTAAWNRGQPWGLECTTTRCTCASEAAIPGVVRPSSVGIDGGSELCWAKPARELKNSGKRAIDMVDCRVSLEMEPGKRRSDLMDGAWKFACGQRGLQGGSGAVNKREGSPSSDGRGLGGGVPVP